jgi:hypothetical protein
VNRYEQVFLWFALVLLRQFRLLSPLGPSESISVYQRFNGFRFHLSALIPFCSKVASSFCHFFAPMFLPKTSLRFGSGSARFGFLSDFGFRFVFLKLRTKWLQFSRHKYSCQRLLCLLNRNEQVFLLVLLRQLRLLSPLGPSASISVYQRSNAFSGFRFQLSALIPFSSKVASKFYHFFAPMFLPKTSLLLRSARGLRISALGFLSAFALRISDLEFVSDFGFRISDFRRRRRRTQTTD